MKALGRSHPITPASETDPKALGDAFFCHVNEERIVFVSSQTLRVGVNFVYMFPVRCMLCLHGSSVEIEEFSPLFTAIRWHKLG